VDPPPSKYGRDVTEFPAGFFARADEAPDREFYSVDRLVTHLDQGAIDAVSELYRELALDGDVLDICSSWISHFDPVPARLVALGMNRNELAANDDATDTLVHDLNSDPAVPFEDASFDAVPRMSLGTRADRSLRSFSFRSGPRFSDGRARLSARPLSVDRRNPAIRLYERLGFEIVRTDGDSVVMLADRDAR
jgi:hypothetical protein